MKNSMGIIATLAIMAIFAGCASISKEECLTIDWFEIGRIDGTLGRPRSSFQGHYKACLEHAVQADSQAYYRGYEEGLKYYCTEQKGFELGRQGQARGSVCPPQLGQDFAAGYEEGLKYYCTEQKGFELGRQGQAYRYVCPPYLEPDFRAGYERGTELRKYELKVSTLERRLEKIEHRIRNKEKELYSANLSNEQRAQIRSDLKYLDLEHRDVVRELQYLEKTKPVAQTN